MDRMPAKVDDQVIEIAPPPPPPPGMLTKTRDDWRSFWGTPLARVVDRTNEGRLLIYRLFSYYDEWERSRRALKRKRFTEGSTGQPVLNPAGKYMLDLENKIVRIEVEVGLTTRRRIDLGLQANAVRKAVDDANDAFEEPDEDEFELPSGVTVIPAKGRAS